MREKSRISAITMLLAAGLGLAWRPDVAAQAAPPGHPPGTIHPKSVPVDPKAADDRNRRQASEEPSRVRRVGERESYGKGRDADRRPADDKAARLKAERDSRKVNPEPESSNRRADSPSRIR